MSVKVHKIESEEGYAYAMFSCKMVNDRTFSLDVRVTFLDKGIAIEAYNGHAPIPAIAGYVEYADLVPDEVMEND